MVERGCLSYLAHIHDTSVASPCSLDFVRIVREFIYVFPMDLLILPLYYDVDFAIDVETNTKPISILSYSMAPTELKELKDQLQELLDKGFIRPSILPWGVPVLFVKKNNGSMWMCIDYR